MSGTSATTAASAEISFSARSQNQPCSSTTPGYRSAAAALAVETGHRLEHADRLVRPLALDHAVDDQLQAALDLLDVNEGGGQADLRTHGHRSGEADLVEPVVHRHLHVSHLQDLRKHRDEQ